MRLNLESIKNLLKSVDNEYDFYGIRADECIYTIGSIANNSHQLFQDPEFDDDGELIYEMGEGIYSEYYDAGELDGTCCVEFDPENENSIESALNMITQYSGDNIHIICGDYCKCGNDRGEIIIRDAKVIGQFTKGGMS